MLCVHVVDGRVAMADVWILRGLAVSSACPRCRTNKCSLLQASLPVVERLLSFPAVQQQRDRCVPCLPENLITLSQHAGACRA